MKIRGFSYLMNYNLFEGYTDQFPFFNLGLVFFLSSG